MAGINLANWRNSPIFYWSFFIVNDWLFNEAAKLSFANLLHKTIRRTKIQPNFSLFTVSHHVLHYYQNSGQSWPSHVLNNITQCSTLCSLSPVKPRRVTRSSLQTNMSTNSTSEALLKLGLLMVFGADLATIMIYIIIICMTSLVTAASSTCANGIQLTFKTHVKMQLTTCN